MFCEETMMIEPFLNEDGRIIQLPMKQSKRRAVLSYLSRKFRQGTNYTEKQVNAICEEWHTFGDYFVLRRGLVDEGFLKRKPDGTAYWREPDKK